MPPPQKPSPRSGNWLRLGLVVLVVAAIAGFYTLGLHRYLSWESIRANLDDWKAWAAEQPVQAAFLFFLAYVAMTALSLPAAALLTLLCGALFGRVLGVGISSVAATCGGMLAFLASRYLLRDWVRRRFGERLRGLDAGVQRDGHWYLLTMRLIPVFPYFLINLGMALTPMPLGTFVLTTWLGMLPGSFLYVNAGTELGRIQRPAEALSPTVLGSLALLGLVPLLLRWVLARFGLAGARKDAPAEKR